VRLHLVLLFLLFGLYPVLGQTSPETNKPTGKPPRALPVSAAELNAAATADAVPTATPTEGVTVRWYGHGFVYLTSSVGIRAAIDPFGPETVKYKFPDHLSADLVLVSHESEDHCAADLIFGNPLIFRSVMAVGLQRANGIPFYGVALQKDAGGQGGANTAFKISFDGVSFCYLGQITRPLLAQEKVQLGHADVVFLPVGLTTLTPTELNQIAVDLGSKIIIPINYKTDASGALALRSLSEYLDACKLPLRKFDSNQILLTRGTLPETPTIYLLKSP